MKKSNTLFFPSGKWKKILLIMNLKLILFLYCLGTVVAAPALSQHRTMNVSFDKTPLTAVLNELRVKSGYKFLYYENIIPRDAVVSVTMSNATIEHILDEILPPAGLTYALQDEVVVLSKSPTSAMRSQQDVPVTITGRVTEPGGAPIPGATVVVKDMTTVGTTSDAEGNFRLTVSRSTDIILLVSFIGRRPVEVDYNGTAVNVVLEEDATTIQDVVITGIFTRAKESYTGSVRTVTAEELRQAGNRSVLTSLANIDPSFNLTKSLMIGSDPNQLPSVSMRGNTSLQSNIRELQSDSRLQGNKDPNQPLFIMDGFEVSLERVMDLDENQIETITLLKDASATALYGTRGANGVVVITSQLPAEGRLRVYYKGDLSIEAPDLTSYDLMNAAEKLDYEVRAGLYQARTPSATQRLQAQYNDRLMKVMQGVDTYWLKYPVRTGIGNKHSIRVDAGGNELRFGAGLQYNKIRGAMKGSDRTTLNGNLQVNYKLRNLSFQNNLQISDNKAFNSPYGQFSEWTKIKSYYKPYDDNGDLIKKLEDWTYNLFYGSGEYDQSNANKVYNPLWNALLDSRNESKYRLVKNDFAMDWKIMEDLNLRARFSVSARNYRADIYKPSSHTDFDEYSGDDISRKGEYSLEIQESLKYEGDVTLSYSKLFKDKHQFYAGASVRIEQDKYEGYKFEAEGISNPRMDFLGMAALYKKDAGPIGDDQFSRSLGATLNLSYTYDRRYFADVTGTLEASSKFGSKNRAAPFFSTGVGWNIHQEEFLRGTNIFDQARLRMSYGTSGSQDFDAYQALLTYYDYGDLNYMGWYGSYMRGLGNKELGWQKTHQLNIGTDINVLKNCVQLSFDFYNKLTDDLLSDITIPSATGFNSYKANVGKVRNRGYEVSLNTVLIRNTALDIYWNLGAMLVYNKNTLLKISDTLEFLNEELRNQNNLNPSFLYEEGKSVNTIYAVPSLGIDPGSGKEIFVKRDGTLTYDWDSADQVGCGISQPPYRGNFTTMFRYKGWTLNGIFSYYWGGQMYNYTLASKVENISPYDNADRRAYYDRWKEPGDQAKYKSVVEKFHTRSTSRFLMNDRIFTLSNLKLGYTFDAKWMKRIGMEYLNLSCSTEDVFVISSIKQERGTYYPFSRKFYFTVSTTF